MSKERDALGNGRRLAKRVARANDKLAARLAELRRIEDLQARELTKRPEQSETPEGQAQTPDAPVSPTRASKPRLRALLIINTKSGPNNDSILRVKELVERFAAHGIRADVRVKLRKKYAREDAKKAAKKGYPLVIAAGGDGTIACVAEGLLGTDTVLGIVPLGTYNNVATSLGVPMELEASIALIASGVVRAIDVGLVTATGANRPRIFLEMAAVGLTAAMMPVGQDVKMGRWQSATAALPAALQMTPTRAEVRLDKAKEGKPASTLLIEIANAPRCGPGLITSPDARVDDGLLDVAVYHEHTQAMLAARFVALKTGLISDDAQIEQSRARRVEVRTDNPLAVVADSKVVGRTPARFEVLAGCLLVAAGRGIGLEQKPLQEVVEAAAVAAALPEEEKDEIETTAVALSTPPAPEHKRGPLEMVTDALTPAANKAMDTLEKARDALRPS